MIYSVTIAMIITEGAGCGQHPAHGVLVPPGSASGSDTSRCDSKGKNLKFGFLQRLLLGVKEEYGGQSSSLTI